MAYTEKDLKYFQQSELQPQDKFTFGCDMCGNCCRKRQSPIMLTGPDIFKIARGLNATPIDIVSKYCEWYIGDQSHMPVVILKERLGQCTIQSFKPAVCALFPLGRYYDDRDGAYHYFIQRDACNTALKTEWTLQSWLDNFHIKEEEDMYIQWNKLVVGIAQSMVRMEKSGIDTELAIALLEMMYLRYTPLLPYNRQIEMNMAYAKQYFKKHLGKTITF